jgi:hypothetical protein
MGAANGRGRRRGRLRDGTNDPRRSAGQQPWNVGRYIRRSATGAGFGQPLFGTPMF